MYSLLADVIVVVHFAYVAFVVAGMLAILLGLWQGWNWVRNFWFRTLHLLAIGIVAYQAVRGHLCPLTVWEYRLRMAAGEEPEAGSFVARIIHSVLFFELEPWVFTAGYVLFGMAVLVTFLLAPPQWPRRTPE